MRLCQARSDRLHLARHRPAKPALLQPFSEAALLGLDLTEDREPKRSLVLSPPGGSRVLYLAATCSLLADSGRGVTG
jgi:hypothetical protein